MFTIKENKSTSSQIPLDAEAKSPTDLMTSMTEAFEPSVTLKNLVPVASCSCVFLQWGSFLRFHITIWREILGVKNGERHQPSKGHLHPTLSHTGPTCIDMRLASL